MVVTKAIVVWLFVVGVLWTFAHVWFHLAMTTMTEPVSPLPIHFLWLFIGPAVLIIGSLLLIAHWHPRIGIVLILVGCIFLTWEFAPECVAMIREAPHQDAQFARVLYIMIVSFSVITLSSDAAAIILLRRVYNKTI